MKNVTRDAVALQYFPSKGRKYELTDHATNGFHQKTMHKKTHVDGKLDGRIQAGSFGKLYFENRKKRNLNFFTKSAIRIRNSGKKSTIVHSRSHLKVQKRQSKPGWENSKL